MSLVNDNVASVRVDPDAESKQSGPTAPVSVTPELESKFYKEAGVESGAASLLRNQQNLGLLGKMFGSKASAPTNIAGLVVLLCFILLAASFFLPTTTDLSHTRTGLLSLLGTALGFLFGSSVPK